MNCVHKTNTVSLKLDKTLCVNRLAISSLKTLCVNRLVISSLQTLCVNRLGISSLQTLCVNRLVISSLKTLCVNRLVISSLKVRLTYNCVPVNITCPVLTYLLLRRLTTDHSTSPYHCKTTEIYMYEIHTI